MAKYSRGQVDRAGNVLRGAIADYSVDDTEEAKEILTYWRYIHTPVINGFQAMLRNKISGEYKKMGFIAQRLKRTPSILFKLDREPKMRLCRMQDIAGIRAIMKKLSDVHLLSNDLQNGRHKHELISQHDYILKPKEDSGYRSMHLIFKYNNPKIPESNGLLIEVQIRTRLQHIWATAVETLGTFLNISLKSGFGDPAILEFFALCSSAFAIIEKTPILERHKYPSALKLFDDLVQRYDTLMIKDRLQGYTVATQQVIKIRGSKHFLMILDTKEKNISIQSYSKKRLDKANVDYTETEMAFKNDPSKEVVLVSIDKISNLKNAYPNYFLDAKDFIGKIEAFREMVSKNSHHLNQLSLNL